VKRWAHVTVEGPKEDLFDQEESEESETVPVDEEEEGPEVPDLTSNVYDNVANLRGEGFDVDNDMDPAPENIPIAAEAPRSLYKDWSSVNVCHRLAAGHRNKNPVALNKAGQPWIGLTWLKWFQHFLPLHYIETVVLVETNKVLTGRELTIGEFFVFIGLWLVMSGTAGMDRKSWFEPTAPSPWEGAPFRLHLFMSLYRFESIISSLRFTNISAPTFRDKFAEVQQMLVAFNTHMQQCWIAGWVSCLDESMSSWTNKYSCPGWVYVPRKPHPVGNEYHTVCCGVSGVMYSLELVEGKDSPVELRAEFGELGKTTGLLLRLCRPLFGTGKLVVLDSGFCVLQALVELQKNGVFASALIKKRRYWPKHVDAETVQSYFANKEIGWQDRLPGQLDGVDFDLFCLKEPDYVMILMSTYGALISSQEQKISTRIFQGEKTTFKYTEVIANHYKYRGAVDEHNNRQHDAGGLGVSIESTWQTQRWAIRVFCFVCIAVPEVNAFLARFFFNEKRESAADFRKKLAYECIHNELNAPNNYEPPLTRNTRRFQANHVLETAPLFSKWVNGAWVETHKQKYQQSICSRQGCVNRCRTVCCCDRSLYFCNSCFPLHFAEVCISQQPG